MKSIMRLTLAPAALCLSLAAHAQNTPIQHVVVLFQENVSFDHYFGTYPNAQNNSGDQLFYPYPGTPAVNGLSPELLSNNPNTGWNASGTTGRVNPARYSPAQAYTCSQNHNYGPEQQAVDGGLMDQFPKYTGRYNSTGCATDGSTVLAYYDGNTVAAFWNYAQNYALNDNSFGSTFGPSTTGALNLVAGQTYGGLTHFGVGSTASFPNSVSVGPAASGYSPNAPTGTVVTDVGDFDPYLDDCGADVGGTNSSTTTLEMNSDATAQTGNRNIGDLLNAAGVTWGWFQGGFRPTVTAANNGGIAVCGASRTLHEYPTGTPTVIVPNPAAPLYGAGTNIHTSGADYVQHHEPFQFYASTRNPHHLPPTSTAMIGQADQANHQYDTIDFFNALAAGNLPAVSFIKAPYAYNGHPGNSDPISEQYWITQTINAIMQSPQWANTAIIIAYDDSDGWYDHVTGPVVSPSNVSNASAGVVSATGNTASSSTYDNYVGVGNCGTPVSGAQVARCGHGPRLPLLVISPFANSNYVDHTLTDQTSIINFIESNWSLGYIDGPTAPPSGQGSFDRLAGTLNGLFNFNNPPNTAPLLLTCSGAVASTPAQACALDPTE
jgi:phospholipase C